MPRGSNNPEIVTIYWRDIPAQVNAQRGRERQQIVLPEKFERAIDRAKRKAKIVTAHEDVAQWRRVSRPCGEDLAAEAASAAAALIADYSSERLGKLGYAGGFADAGGGGVESDDIERVSSSFSSTDPAISGDAIAANTNATNATAAKTTAAKTTAAKTTAENAEDQPS